MRLNVLDHGFVELIEVMGDDAEPARAARISYGNTNERSWAQDAKLIKYLWDNQHTTPFEMIELKWRAKMPIFVARQWVRHRTANINEFSMRYADPERLSESGEIEFYIPDEWRYPDPTNKQGSQSNPSGPYDQTVEEGLRDDYFTIARDAVQWYKLAQKAGIANEMARMILPVATYTEWIWKNDLHNTLHFLKLRTDEHAQWEMRCYADAMRTILHDRLPNLMNIVDSTFPDVMQ